MNEVQFTIDCVEHSLPLIFFFYAWQNFLSSIHITPIYALLRMALTFRVQKLPNSIIKNSSRSPQPLRALPLQQIRRLATADVTDLDARKCDRERVVILGSGWAGRFSYP